MFLLTTLHAGAIVSENETTNVEKRNIRSSVYLVYM